MKTVIICGVLAGKPFNGVNAWSRLSWILGFKKLGFDVVFVEQLSPNSCVDASGQPSTFEDSINPAIFQAIMKQFGLAQSSSLMFEDDVVCGMPLPELIKRSAKDTFLFNMSGHLTRADLKDRFACRIYYDDDPGFTQFWHAAGNSGAHLNDHHFYFTIGENIGAPDCLIPANEIPWRHTRPPIVLEDWPVISPSSFDRFTTVASWRGAYAPVQDGNKSYGVKAHQFRKFLEISHRTDHGFEIALDIHPEEIRDLAALRANRWKLVDPKEAAGSPDLFRKYVQRSGAEFSVAQGVYVDTVSGWFSDRTTRYLASGRPTLVQDTGFSRYYPVGEGLLAFQTLDDAIEGTERIVCDYPIHCAAARRIAEEYFDSDKIIRQMMSEIGLSL